MTQQTEPQQRTEQRTSGHGSEWLWRFLALAMLFMVGWVGWIAYQISPSPIATQAAYQAEAQARARQNVQQGAVKPAPRKPPVDAEKLRLADSIQTPIPEKK